MLCQGKRELSITHLAMHKPPHTTPSSRWLQEHWSSAAPPPILLAARTLVLGCAPAHPPGALLPHPKYHTASSFPCAAPTVPPPS
jgi:hypothetical protein